MRENDKEDNINCMYMIS